MNSVNGAAVSLTNTVFVMGNEFDPNLTNNEASQSTMVSTLAAYQESLEVSRLALNDRMPVIEKVNRFKRKQVVESACVMVPIIYSSCQGRRCFPSVNITLPERQVSFVSISFGSGVVYNENISKLVEQRSRARVQFDVLIPLEVVLRRKDNSVFVLAGNLPSFHMDILHYYPKTRSESVFSLNVSTRSELLFPAVIRGSVLAISVGTFVFSFISLPVDLRIPSYGYCPEPEECINGRSSMGYCLQAGF